VRRAVRLIPHISSGHSSELSPETNLRFPPSLLSFSSGVILAKQMMSLLAYAAPHS
jgi:hypothetical protein